ncbi:sugar phosphate isomerase/epimerase [Peptoniphilus sp. AGMB00490]|uniref:Sugar phosphate isomerase/epimerase n=1 Tax=Peptoniphilus faecalis TaxID=2731255 RepID=A0A848R996_9FIRM|nr:sugar phosphate isomerase/epimerase [Peptoniphilus faecalis]NMW84388.1 sugar phosphate isomerase/epimerase [Peptoniphilus faecalis]
MTFEYSLAQLTVLETSPVEIAKIAAECGYDYVSLRQIYMGVKGEKIYDLRKDKKLMQELKGILKNTGLKVLDIELARIFDGVNIKDYEPAMKTCRELGGKHILSSIWTDNKDFYTEEFAKLCDLAKSNGLTVDVEYVPIAGVNNLKQTVELLNDVNRDNAGIMLDMHHIHRAGDKPEDIAKIPKEWFHFAHLCDASGEIPKEKEEMIRIMREARDYVGDGGIDIASILNSMPIVPYSIELPNSAHIKEYGLKGHAQNCLDKAKAYCNKFVKGRE